MRKYAPRKLSSIWSRVLRERVVGTKPSAFMAARTCTSSKASAGAYTAANFARDFCGDSDRSGKTSAKCNRSAGASRRAITLDQYTSRSKASSFPLYWKEYRMKETRQKI